MAYTEFRFESKTPTGGKKMFTVGEFSRICQVSIKTLHHYDRISLLAPLKVDPFSGYRYYGQQQVEKMLLIERMKRYGFSLEDIRLLLECGDNRVLFSKLCQQKEKLKTQKQEMELIINELSAHLQDFERTGDIMAYQKNYEITVTTAPDRIVLASRQVMGVKDFGTYYSSLYERMAKEHLTPDGMRGAVYYDDEFKPKSTDIELIVGIREKEKADKVMKGQLCAKTVHKGPYSSLPDAYGALTAWISENGYSWAGAPYEIYVKTQFDHLSPEDWETEVYFPVSR